ncbi:hypothetical protein TNCV_2751001 [Trichonephila clavipes]|nr:hypothetical protein TNCV_2751001 [Trichonephila clavipes]
MAIIERWRVNLLVRITFVLLLSRCRLVLTEYLQEFEISEGLGVGTTIGYIGHSRPASPKPPPPPPYLIVPGFGTKIMFKFKVLNNYSNS